MTFRSSFSKSFWILPSPWKGPGKILHTSQKFRDETGHQDGFHISLTILNVARTCQILPSFWSFWCKSALALSQILPEMFHAAESPCCSGIFPWKLFYIFPVNLEDERQIPRRWKSPNKTKKEKRQKRCGFMPCIPCLTLEMVCCLPWLRKGLDGWKYKLATGRTPAPDLLVKSSPVVRMGKENCRFPGDWGAIAPWMDGLVDI